MVVNLSDKFCPLPNSAAKRVGCRWDRSQLRFWTGIPEMTELDVGWVPMADPVFGPSRWGGLQSNRRSLFLILILCAVLCLALVINLFDVDSVRLPYIAHIYCKSHSHFLLASTYQG